MAAQKAARASPELRVTPLSSRYRRNYTTPGGTTEFVRPFQSHSQSPLLQ